MALFIQYMLYFIGHFPMKFFLKAQVYVPQVSSKYSKPLIIASNHTSKLDPFLMFMLPFSLAKQLIVVHFLIAEHYYEKWWLKPLIKLIGGLTVKEWGWTFDDFLENGLEILNNNQNLMIFPEGRIIKSEDEIVQKTGIVYLASKSNANILPMYIHGISGINFFDFILRKKTATVKIGVPFSIRKVDADRLENYPKIVKQVINKIYSL